MEKQGWLQGSIVSRSDTERMTSHFGHLPKDIFLIVASQSCDVANLSEENIEFSIAEKVSKLDGNCMFNKNPRTLHIAADDTKADRTVSAIYLQLSAHQKVSISKKELFNLGIDKPCESITLDKDVISNYVDWLASRYKRPALPSEFDRRVDIAWDKKSRNKAFSKLSEHIEGIYIEIFPSKEIKENEQYSINLLVLVTNETESTSVNFKRIEALMEKYKEKLEKVSIDTTSCRVHTKSQVSLETFDRFKRINLDSLSYKLNHPLPPDV